MRFCHLVESNILYCEEYFRFFLQSINELNHEYPKTFKFLLTKKILQTIIDTVRYVFNLEVSDV